MTVSELYNLTKVVMFEPTSSNNYDDYLIGNVNRLISELYEDNNMKRIFKGKSPMKSVPYVSSKHDVLTFEDEYTHDVMPKGLAAYFMQDDDMNKYSVFHTDYLNAIQKHQVMVSRDRL